jgi:osmotically-inducible protein OsmY
MKDRDMKALILCACIASVCACAMTALGGTDGAVGTFVIDSAITFKVKANLVARHLPTLADVGVDTDKDGIVWLSGTVPSRSARGLAEFITKNTAGVTAVRNHIVID